MKGRSGVGKAMARSTRNNPIIDDEYKLSKSKVDISRLFRIDVDMSKP